MLPEQALQLIRNDFMDSGRPVLWADLGCGAGTFTRALSRLLPEGSFIYAVDRQQQTEVTLSTNKAVSISFQQKDFEKDKLDLPLLDGILMANALHYVSDKTKLIQKLEQYLKPEGVLLIVEYDTRSANRWVPYPIDRDQLKKLFSASGFEHTKVLGTLPSVFGQGLIYACYISRR